MPNQPAGNISSDLTQEGASLDGLAPLVEPAYIWDFFLAHSSTDRDGGCLHDLLKDDCRVFLDHLCLQLGDDWDVELARAQQASRITVVLISKNTEKAYYQREEIAGAIAMARQDTHRVVPIFLGGLSNNSNDVPYGMRLKKGLSVRDKRELKDAAGRLLKLLSQVKGRSAYDPRRSMHLRSDHDAATNLADGYPPVLQDGPGLDHVGPDLGGRINAAALPMAVSPVSGHLDDSIAPSPGHPVKMQVKIDHDFHTFTDEVKEKFLAAIGKMLDIADDLRVLKIQEGCTKLTLELSAEQADRLLVLLRRVSSRDLVSWKPKSSSHRPPSSWALLAGRLRRARQRKSLFP